MGAASDSNGETIAQILSTAVNKDIPPGGGLTKFIMMFLYPAIKQ